VYTYCRFPYATFPAPNNNELLDLISLYPHRSLPESFHFNILVLIQVFSSDFLARSSKNRDHAPGMRPLLPERRAGCRRPQAILNRYCHQACADRPHLEGLYVENQNHLVTCIRNNASISLMRASGKDASITRRRVQHSYARTDAASSSTLTFWPILRSFP